MPPTDDAIRARAEQLAQSRPWCTDEQNWTDAKRALEGPRLLQWRPSFLRWFGASEKTGWDWADLSLKLSVPLTIALLGTYFGNLNNQRQNQIAVNNQKDAVLSKYLERMESLILDRGLKKGALNDDVSSVARTLTLVSLSQLSEPGETRRGLVLQFLQEVGLIKFKQVRVPLANADFQGADLEFANLSSADLSRANLTNAKLIGASLSGSNLAGASLSRANLIMADFTGAILDKTDFIGANLLKADLSDAALSKAIFIEADLTKADISGADLSKAYLIDANLSKANLAGADLSGAVLSGVRWDEETQWPDKAAFKGTKYIPPELKKQLGLD